MGELRYRVVTTTSRNETIMWDTLLSRIFDGDAFLVFRKKKEKTWRFYFWMTDEEFEEVCMLIENAKGEKWDEEYEDLLSERSQ